MLDGSSSIRKNYYESMYMKSVAENSGKFIPEHVVEKYLEQEKDSARLQRLKKKFTENKDFQLKSMTDSVFFDYVPQEKKKVYL